MPARKKKNRHINLLPKEDFERTILGRVLRWALTTFRYIVILVELVVILGFLSRFWLDVKISDLDDEIKQKSALISSRSSFEKEFRRTKQKLSLFSTLTDPNLMASTFLKDVVNNLPQDVQLTSFDKTGTQVEVRGASVSENSISAFLNSLSEVADFDSVVLTKIESTADSPLVEFTIQATVKESV